MPLWVPASRTVWASGSVDLATLIRVSNSCLSPRFSRSASSSEIGYEKCATLGGELPGERREKVSVSFAPLEACDLSGAGKEHQNLVTAATGVLASLLPVG